MENKECCKGKRHWRCSFWKCVGWGLLGIVGVTLFVLVFGAGIMWLWNCLVPPVFHLTTITFWQAVGLAVLARLLFGGMGHGMRHRGMKRWKHGHHGHSHCNCGCGSNCQCHSDENKSCECDSHANKWQHYDKYWAEEGEKAYDEYVKRQPEKKE